MHLEVLVKVSLSLSFDFSVQRLLELVKVMLFRAYYSESIIYIYL